MELVYSGTMNRMWLVSIMIWKYERKLLNFHRVPRLCQGKCLYILNQIRLQYKCLFGQIELQFCDTIYLYPEQLDTKSRY